MYVSADTLNVRDSWSSGGTLVGTLKKGAAVTVTGTCSNGWVRIKYSGFTAYVSGSYLSDTQGGSSGGSDSGSDSGSGSGSGSGGTTVADSGAAAEVANFALSFVGYAYVYGGSSPSTGFDCSGLMVDDGDHLMLDDSSTSLYVAKRLKEKKDLTVITNSVELVVELAGMM